MPKIAPITEGGGFKEGESEDYNSELEESVDSEDQINFDLIEVKKEDSAFHKPLLKMISKFGKPDYTLTFEVAEHKAIKKAKAELAERDESEGEVQELEVNVVKDYLTCDQAFIFADECRIF
jgi:phosphoribosylaminoimidazole-succinocarboxamide synthase